MGAIINFGINLDKLDKSKVVKNPSGTWLNLTLSVNDEVGQYGDNASIFISQSKEERESKAKRTYVGNGKVAWTDGTIVAAPKEATQAAAAPVEDGIDLPF